MSRPKGRAGFPRADVHANLGEGWLKMDMGF